MTIDEAIRLQGLLCESSILDPIPKYKESAKLGIEALKHLKNMRIKPDYMLYQKLPGETKD